MCVRHLFLCFFEHQDFEEFPHTPEFLKCPTFPDVMSFLDFMFSEVLGNPVFSICPAFFEYNDFPEFPGILMFLKFHVFFFIIFMFFWNSSEPIHFSGYHDFPDFSGTTELFKCPSSFDLQILLNS